MSVFKAYDIRGIYPSQIDEDLARRMGAALVHLLRANRLVVGRDMRQSAPSIQDAVMEGITSQGCNVLDIGLVSTPMAYYAIGALSCDGGLATTASHNPPEYIGAKICRAEAKPMSAETGLRDIERMVAEQDFAPQASRGRIEQVDIQENYRDHLLRFAVPWSARKVAIDTANGMGGLEVPLLLKDSPLDWQGIFLDLDGLFPNHEANPLKDENIADLRELLLGSGGEVGFAFDGDGDRCCVLDEKGERVGSDLVTALLAREFLREEPGASIVYDLRSSRALAEEIEGCGGKAVRERVGHSFIKATMRQDNSPFAGELSGHFYFRDHFFSDCASLAMIHMLNLLEKEQRPLSELVAPLKKYCSTGEVNFEVADPKAKIEELKSRYGDGEQDELDGITVCYPDYWFNVRMSNTEPLLRLRLEADTDDLLARKQDELCALLGTPL
jgi:phosphomannomutase